MAVIDVSKEKCEYCGKPIMEKSWVRCRHIYFCNWDCYNKYENILMKKSNLLPLPLMPLTKKKIKKIKRKKSKKKVKKRRKK